MADFAEALFRAYWSEDRDISQTPVLEALCEELAIDATWLLRAVETPEIKAKLRSNTDELVDRGGFGSPTIFVNGDDMYFGNDRLVLVREALVRKQVGRNAAPVSSDVN
jgi:2-hydroxychromene-2-carboxylate isomerase